ncbi:MAG: phosphoribosyltransferase [Gammaproteobacteria bacterium]
MAIRFADRHDAGRKLAGALHGYAGREDVLVLALPRGGVPVGYEVARALKVDFDILIVRKLGVPYQPELAMGAVASGGALYLNRSLIDQVGISRHEIEAVLAAERTELTRRERLYRGERPPSQIEGRIIILVDDGVATGASMHSAVMALRTGNPARIIVAVPVAPDDAGKRFEADAVEFVSLFSPAYFQAVGQFYDAFDQTSDEEVRDLLSQFQRESSS